MAISTASTAEAPLRSSTIAASAALSVGQQIARKQIKGRAQFDVMAPKLIGFPCAYSLQARR